MMAPPKDSCRVGSRLVEIEPERGRFVTVLLPFCSLLLLPSEEEEAAAAGSREVDAVADMTSTVVGLRPEPRVEFER